MRRLLSASVAAVLFGAAPACAGLDVPPAAPDMAALAAAAAAQVQQAMPAPCGAVPSPDTLMGSPGSANCFVPRDAARPTVVQAGNVSTDSTGAWSVTWARPFTSASPIVIALPVNGATNPAVCNVASRTASGASGKCWQSNGVTVSILGTIVNVFASAPSLSLMVIAREPTQ